MTQPQLPQQLSLTDRKKLSVTAVREVKSFDENLVVLLTDLGELSIHGQSLQLKDLSVQEGRAAVEGDISALIYQEPRSRGFWSRFLG
ncbi:MAG: sporulation protein YabP [Ruminococcaceae bacterium]|nr:sporulation protein YabP [Oscillospiraceae bacterium]